MISYRDLTNNRFPYGSFKPGSNALPRKQGDLRENSFSPERYVKISSRVSSKSQIIPPTQKLSTISELLSCLHQLKPAQHDYEKIEKLTAFKQVAEEFQKILDTSGRAAVIFDNDTDGITSAAIIERTMRLLKPDAYIKQIGISGSNKFLTPDMLKKAELSACKTLIILDLPLTPENRKLISQAQDQGFKVIMIDHHEFDKNDQEGMPDFLLNPVNASANLASYSTSQLCLRVGENLLENYTTQQLEAIRIIAMIGLIADFRPDSPDNIKTINQGLNILNQSESVLARALKTIFHLPAIAVDDIKMRIVPTLNSGRRLGLVSSEKVLSLFTSKNFRVAHEILERLQISHVLRRTQGRSDKKESQKDEKVTPVKKQQIIKKVGESVVLVARPGLREAGPEASRLVRESNKIVFAVSLNNRVVGSGRSPVCDFINLSDLANYPEISDCLVQSEGKPSMGGHAHAVGLEIKPDRIEDFFEHADRILTSIINGRDLRPVLKPVAEIPLNLVIKDGLQIYDYIQQNTAYPQPVFLIRDLVITNCYSLNPDAEKSCRYRLQLRDQSSNNIIQADYNFYQGRKLMAGNKIDVVAKVILEREDQNRQRIALEVVDLIPNQK